MDGRPGLNGRDGKNGKDGKDAHDGRNPKNIKQCAWKELTSGSNEYETKDQGLIKVRLLKK